MAVDELSPRALRLTEHVISMNPAHYTVWLFRFKIINALNISIPDEITWLNSVALENLKNYQIWHHRQLLLNAYAPTISDDADKVKSFARSEVNFIKTMLEDDAKNYHVWSYRQYLVRKLNLFNMAELLSTQNLIETDVRNNSAWSHRFFLTFSDPAHSTPDSLATEHDPEIPSNIIEREVNYAKEKISLAPQNQSPWNYLRGVLVKAGKPLGSEAESAETYVSALGQDNEEVRSSHALDFLAEVYQEKGDKDKAALCLQRLADKWDPVRAGYWKYRAQQL